MEDHRGALAAAGGTLMVLFAGLAADAWKSGHGVTASGVPNQVPQPAFSLLLLAALVSCYFILAVLLRWPPCRDKRSADRLAVYKELGRFLSEGDDLKYWLLRQADRLQHPGDMVKGWRSDGEPKDVMEAYEEWREELRRFVSASVSSADEALLFTDVGMLEVTLPPDFPVEWGSITPSAKHDDVVQARYVVEALTTRLIPLIERYRS